MKRRSCSSLVRSRHSGCFWSVRKDPSLPWGAEVSPLQSAAEIAFLRSVVEAGQPGVQPLGAEESEEPSYGLRTPDWHDGDALGAKISTTALGERFERELVADPFDEHDRARIDSRGQVPRLRVRLAPSDRALVAGGREQTEDGDGAE